MSTAFEPAGTGTATSAFAGEAAPNAEIKLPRIKRAESYLEAVCIEG